MGKTNNKKSILCFLTNNIRKQFLQFCNKVRFLIFATTHIRFTFIKSHVTHLKKHNCNNWIQIYCLQLIVSHDCSRKISVHLNHLRLKTNKGSCNCFLQKTVTTHIWAVHSLCTVCTVRRFSRIRHKDTEVNIYVKCRLALE